MAKIKQLDGGQFYRLACGHVDIQMELPVKVHKKH